MRYKKLSLLLVVSLVFFLVLSLILICAWFYYYFYDNDKADGKLPAADFSVQNRTRDSLQKMYTASLNSFDSASSGTDSLRTAFNNKLVEFYRLRNEITSILRNHTNADDLELARQKIGSLQLKIDDLRSRTMKVEYENKRLNALLQQLSNELRGQATTVRKSAPALSKVAAEKQIASFPSNIGVSDVRIVAITGNEEKEEETSVAENADKLVGSVVIKNNSGPLTGGELMVVILQPDGRVFQSAAWESGTFETSEGKKIYSTKIVFDSIKGDSRRLAFSIKAGDLQKGEYIARIYQNGLLAGTGKTILY